MAEPALKKLEEDTTCAICLNDFKDPKLLLCFHVFCKDCLEKLVQGEHEKTYLRCPTCRRLTHISPGNDVSSLPAAFNIHRLFEIKDALVKAKERQTKCQKCQTSSKIACSYCRDCGEFICEACTGIHNEWEDLKTHEVIPLIGFEEKVKQLNTLRKVPMRCSLHPGKVLELFCETCMELICHNCTVKKHKDHQYDLVDDIFEKNKDKMITSLKPVEIRSSKISKAIEDIDAQSKKIDDQHVAVKSEIEQSVIQLVEILQAQQNSLVSKVSRLSQEKQKNLAKQREDLQATQNEVDRCVSFMSQSVSTDSKGDVLKMMKIFTQQIKTILGNDLSADVLLPCEPANLKFRASTNVATACKSIGVVYLEIACPSKCYATGSGLEVAVQDEKTTIVFHSVNDDGNVCKTPLRKLSSELISESMSKRTKSSVKMLQANQYEINYQPTMEGKHFLQITVDNQHISGSPFTLQVFRKPCTPVTSLDDVQRPYSVAINEKDQVLITEMDKHCVSIFSPAGEKIGSFRRGGMISGLFKNPKGVAVDLSNNLLVVDGDNHRIRKFTADWRHLSTVGKEGNRRFEFRHPSGIAVHPKSGRIYVADTCNHRVHVLNTNLTFISTFGSNGTNDGEFSYPHDMAFDSDGNVYVVDNSNHRIQVFEPDGKFLRSFGKHGTYDGELNYPTAIAIDHSKNNVVYVTDKDNHRISMFTSEGTFITSFGGKGGRSGQFDMPHGIAVTKNGLVYICDFYNNRVQVFQ